MLGLCGGDQGEVIKFDNVENTKMMNQMRETGYDDRKEKRRKPTSSHEGAQMPHKK